MATAQQVQLVFRRMEKELAKTDDLQRDYGFVIRRQAQRNAVTKPTPQARGVAASLRVGKKGAVFGLPSATIVLSGRSIKAAGINYGSEFGSDRVKQFGPRRESGYWLNPAADQVDDRAGEKWLDRVLDDSLKGIR